MEIKSTYYSYSNHGYLAVKLSDVIDLGIRDLITEYSFYNATTAYLEEDCDMPLFVKTLKVLGYTLNCNDVTYDGPSYFKNLNRFNKE
jgi:hypothetical protein